VREWENGGQKDEKLFFLFFLVMMLLAVSIFLPHRAERNSPEIAGYRMMIVLSGSMSPAFDTGAIIGVKKINPGAIKIGDIITFRNNDDQKKLITHRVVDIVKKMNKRFFVTKGDANDTRDFWNIPEESVIGRVCFAFPYLGYLAGFAQTRSGLVLLLICPFMFICLDWAAEFARGKKRERRLNKHKAQGL